MIDGNKMLRTNNVDFIRAAELTPDVEEAIDNAFTWQPWNSEQHLQGARVRDSLVAAVKMIVKYVPPSADRTAAIRKIREASMTANAAITHGGKF